MIPQELRQELFLFHPCCELYFTLNDLNYKFEKLTSRVIRFSIFEDNLFYGISKNNLRKIFIKMAKYAAYFGKKI
jgi:hypothetical protein